MALLQTAIKTFLRALAVSTAISSGPMIRKQVIQYFAIIFNILEG